MDDKRVCILDYGSGNVKSVFNMIHTLSNNVFISNEKEAIESSTHIILPGVGAFGASMEKIKKNVPLDVLEDAVVNKQKPFLGICVGMQILADKSFEFGEHDGLGWIPGEVRKLDSHEYPLPHIGWNNITAKQQSTILRKSDVEQDFYFVHSFTFIPEDTSCVIATANYGEDFSAIVGAGNIFGVQFHPEKSQKAGIILLENFLNLK